MRAKVDDLWRRLAPRETRRDFGGGAAAGTERPRDGDGAATGRGGGASVTASTGTVGARTERLLERVTADLEESFGVPWEADVVHQNVTGASVDLRVRVTPSAAAVAERLGALRDDYDVGVDGATCLSLRLPLDDEPAARE